MPNTDDLLTKKEVADFFRVTPRTITNWMKEGLPHVRKGKNYVRFEAEPVQKWKNTNMKAVQ